MVEYYLAEKSCLTGVEERLLLKVDEKKLSFVRGETRERFGFDEEGRLTCLTWDGMGLPYSINGPLTDEQTKKIIETYDFSRLPRRILSVRRVG